MKSLPHDMFFPLQQIFPQNLKIKNKDETTTTNSKKKGLKHILLLPASSARFLKAAKSS
jgi:hypothetical protein